MKFKESKPIYLQIADRIMEEILQEVYPEEDRIPSVREYAAMVEVNANTVVRAYDFLQTQNIIFNKRGIGYFVSKGGKKCILKLRRKAFLTEDVPELFRQMELLQISSAEVQAMYDEFLHKSKDVK